MLNEFSHRPHELCQNILEIGDDVGRSNTPRMDFPADPSRNLSTSVLKALPVRSRKKHRKKFLRRPTVDDAGNTPRV